VTVHPLVWVGFVAFILAALSIDLFFFHRDAREVSTREAATWVAVWMTLGISFTAVVWAWLGGVAAGEYIAGYLIEWSLSVDNIFVFVLIFTYFALPARYQHRALFWGIAGALVFRGAFIAGGAVILDAFEWTIYLFGAFLVFTGVRMALSGELELDLEENLILRLLRRMFPITPDYRGEKFFVRENGRRFVTPLFVVLVVINAMDVIFAVDSIPAIFGVTRRTFLVFSSNAFAILGLRAVYFLLAHMMTRFRYLQYGLSSVLVFVGVKMLVSHWVHVPIWSSLAFIVLALGTAVLTSLLAESREARA
jgi:tellurite resistance protein TerC